MASVSGERAIDPRHAAVWDSLRAWSSLTVDDNATDTLARSLRSIGVGGAARVGTSSLCARTSGDERASSIAVVSCHDLGDLSPTARSADKRDAAAVCGPGVASRAGSLLAFLAGAGDNGVFDAHQNGIGLTMLSIGPGDSLMSLASDDLLGRPSLILCTDSIAWNPTLPTITIGSRGRLEAELTISASSAVNDDAYAGATLNPLNRLVEVLAKLRGERGRVGLPGFYDRARPPDRGALDHAGTDDWLDRVGASRPGGSLSGIERATQWPVFSVLGIECDQHRCASPKAATARVAFSLVPDQRPVDVERSLRALLADEIPACLTSSVRVTRSARPYVAEPGQEASALGAALRDVHRRNPVAVPGGGTTGAGELHYRFGVPVLFAGLAGPDCGYGTTDEILNTTDFSNGAAVAKGFLGRLAQPGRGR